MSKKPFQRITFVQLSDKGKSDAMRCDRSDLDVGDYVEAEC
ncbi:hypothetical protein PSH49_22100 [Pseudoalteromonas sp. GABNS16G]|jgi:hypothetical protein|nr:hypothetical protein [Pseudoalteromonas sp. GABNS16G]MDC9603272.1 hypothetical protein [Pseudoalteromonas sp. GABNS16G]